jgi:hypothetical protein
MCMPAGQTLEIVYSPLHNMRVVDEVWVKTSSLFLVKDLERINSRRLRLTGEVGNSDEGIALYPTVLVCKGSLRVCMSCAGIRGKMTTQLKRLAGILRICDITILQSLRVSIRVVSRSPANRTFRADKPSHHVK